MRAFWVFEIGTTKKYSTQDVTFAAVDYAAKVIPSSFGGIQMRWNIGGKGLISPSDLDFDIDNADGSLSRADLEGEYCTIKYIIDGTLSRQWKFKIQRAVSSYKKIKVYCVDILQAVLFGEYPNTPHPREQWVSANHEPEDGERDNYRIPIIFGEAYIPLMYIYHALNDNGYYVLGQDQAYDIMEVKSPAEYGELVWTSDEYTFTQTSDAGYKLAEFSIAVTESEGIYSNGTWRSHSKPLVKYKKTTGHTTNPSAILNETLQAFGAPATDIDGNGTTGTWDLAAASYETAGQEITWNGGFYTSKPKETILGELLSQCDSLIYISDKIELHPFSNTSIETIDISKTKKQSFRISKNTFHYNDSGHVKWAEAGFPQDNLQGKAIVPTIEGGTVLRPSDETFSCQYIGNSITAQKLGILYFQRKLTSQDNISFDTTSDVLTSIATIKPGNVLTINDAMLGDTRDMIISSIHIHPDSKVSITGNTYEQIDAFGSISTSNITVVEPPKLIPTVKIDEDLLPPLGGKSVFIGIKINTRAFNTAADGYAYIHGYNDQNEAADIDGEVNVSGTSTSVPRYDDTENWTLYTSQEGTGYIIFDKSSAANWVVNSVNKNLAFAIFTSKGWFYDNGTEWTSFSPNTSENYIIGRIDRNTTEVEAGEVWETAESVRAANYFPAAGTDRSPGYDAAIPGSEDSSYSVIVKSGSYTATLTPETGSITLAAGFTKLSYTQIDRVVTVTGQIKVDSVTTPSGTLSINLPFELMDLVEESEIFHAVVGFDNMNHASWPGGHIFMIGEV